MLAPELFQLFVKPLNDLGIRYFIGGSVAIIFYGEPRLTLNIDFVVFLNAADVPRLAAAFPISEFYFPPLETIFAELQREQNATSISFIQKPVSKQMCI